MEGSNQQLLTRIAAGDQSAFAEFYDRLAPRVSGWLARWMGPQCDVEDVLQDIFLQVWSSARQYDAERSPPEAWLFLIARCRGTDYLRQHRPEGTLPGAQEPALLNDPGRMLEQTELAQQVRQALTHLPEEQRKAIILTFYAGLTHEQVARNQAIPLGTAKTRIRLGMKRLRHLLSD